MKIFVGENSLTTDDRVVFDTRDFCEDCLSDEDLRNELDYILNFLS